MITDGAENFQSSDGIISQNLESIMDLMCSPVQLQQAVQQLHHLSLIAYESITDTSAPNATTSVLRIHDLVQFMIQESVRRENTHHHWFHVATGLACGAFRRVNKPSSHLCWAQCETLSPHMQALTKWEDEHTLENPELGEANIGIAEYLLSRGRYNEAEMLVVRVLANREKLLGSENIGTLRPAETLATIYREQGRFTQAETLYSRILASREKLLGPEHPETMSTVNHLATVYDSLGQYKEAETLFSRALASREKLLELSLPETLQTVDHSAIVYLDILNNLANTCRYQGRYKEAETLCRQALAGRQKRLGPEHPDTLRTVSNPAIIRDLQGRHEEAETLFGRVLKGREKLFGPEHPETLRTVHSLAVTYHLQDRYEEAETHVPADTGKQREAAWPRASRHSIHGE